jgi:hypothetical protein
VTGLDGEDAAGGTDVGVEGDVAGGAKVGRNADALEDAAEGEELVDGGVRELVRARLGRGDLDVAERGGEELDVARFVLGEGDDALADEARVASTLDCRDVRVRVTVAERRAHSLWSRTLRRRRRRSAPRGVRG